jgi:ATP-dependent Clp protease ATP-binding subunit ClpC
MDKAWIESSKNVILTLTDEMVAEVVSMATNIPMLQITAEESEKLMHMEEFLHKRIIGQDEAIEVLAKSIRRTRAGIKDPGRPSGSFIFAGSTGIGKTELAKTLAEFLFDDEDALIQLDMSEYSEKLHTSRLFGSSPGYVGYEEGGQLTNAVRRNPFSVVLFDEIEKAHPDVLNILLQILDEGKVSDSHGRIANFENTVIIMTSNAGSDKKIGSLGFDKNENELTKEKVTKSLEEFLRPEFLSRVDEIVIFNNLEKQDLIEIARLMLSDFIKFLSTKSINFSYDENSLKLLVEKLPNNKNGARGLKNLIRKEIEDKLASKIINNGSFEIGDILLSGSTQLNLKYSKK